MSDSPFAAYIFDMDDLLIRSSDIWRKAEEALLSSIGHRWTPELAIQYKGMNALDVAATIHRVLSPSIAVADCQQIMRSSLLESFSAKIEAMAGAVDLVRALHGKKPMAVASGSPLAAIRAALTQLSILDCFDHVITSESVARGKPHPDVFLAAANALGVEPKHCLVFEDSLIGVKAAVAAGMAVACVPSGSSDEIRRLTPHVFATLADVCHQPELMPR
jgi:HAD superfamily hydrolase (TIGR01509 family)